jgi:hypothetical protein
MGTCSSRKDAETKPFSTHIARDCYLSLFNAMRRRGMERNLGRTRTTDTLGKRRSGLLIAIGDESRGRARLSGALAILRVKLQSEITKTVGKTFEKYAIYLFVLARWSEELMNSLAAVVWFANKVHLFSMT